MDLWLQNLVTGHVSPSYNFGDYISIRETGMVSWTRWGPGRPSYALVQQRQNHTRLWTMGDALHSLSTRLSLSWIMI